MIETLFHYQCMNLMIIVRQHDQGAILNIFKINTFCHSKNPRAIHLCVLIACGMGFLPRFTLFLTNVC